MRFSEVGQNTQHDTPNDHKEDNNENENDAFVDGSAPQEGPVSSVGLEEEELILFVILDRGKNETRTPLSQ